MKIQFFLIIFLSFVCNGQSNLDVDLHCKLLSDALNNVTTKREFFLCKDDTEFILYDKTGHFELCNSLEVCNKPIVQVFNEEYKEYHPKKYQFWNMQSLLIIYRYDIDDKTNTVYIWRPYSGGNVIFTFEIKDDNIEIVNTQFGTF
jgi:hypothetical protein